MNFAFTTINNQNHCKRIQKSQSSRAIVSATPPLLKPFPKVIIFIRVFDSFLCGIYAKTHVKEIHNYKQINGYKNLSPRCKRRLEEKKSGIALSPICYEPWVR